MSIRPVRPRFRVTVAGTVEATIERLVAAAEARDHVVVRVLGDHVDLTMSAEVRHRWTPSMHIELGTEASGTDASDAEASDSEVPDAEASDTVLVRGLVGPHPNIWTLFAMSAITIATTMAMGAIFGMVELALGRFAWGLIVVAIGAIALWGLYGVSQIGQRLAAEQTAELADVAREGLGVPLS